MQVIRVSVAVTDGERNVLESIRQVPVPSVRPVCFEEPVGTSAYRTCFSFREGGFATSRTNLTGGGPHVLHWQVSRREMEGLNQPSVRSGKRHQDAFAGHPHDDRRTSGDTSNPVAGPGF